MMQKIKILIIDDEQLAREIIKSYLPKDEELVVLGECSDGFEGIKMIQSHQPDIVFLDVMMPKLTGFEMLELLDETPVIVFSTAYDEYAIKAFEKNAVDYLLKPYAKNRFLNALEKAKQKLVTGKKQEQPLPQVLNADTQKSEVLSRIVMKTGSKIHILSVDKIRYMETMDDYVRIHTSEGKFVKQNTMKYYEAHLPPSDFVRIHRSFIVRVKEIARLEPLNKDSYVALLHDKTQLSVSRSGYSKLKEVLKF